MRQLLASLLFTVQQNGRVAQSQMVFFSGYYGTTIFLFDIFDYECYYLEMLSASHSWIKQLIRVFRNVDHTRPIWSAWLKGGIVAAGVLYAVAVSPRLAQFASFAPPPWRALLTAIIFGLLAANISRTADGWLPSPNELRRAAYHLVGAAVFVVATSAVLGWWPTSPFVFVAVLLAAVIEEHVFRISVPRRLAQFLAAGTYRKPNAWFMGQLASQFLFAASHFISRDGLWTSRGITEGARLFAAGTLYANVVHRRGFWLAAGMHAVLNLGLRSSNEHLPQRAGIIVIAVCGAVGIIGLFEQSRSAGNYVISA